MNNSTNLRKGKIMSYLWLTPTEENDLENLMNQSLRTARDFQKIGIILFRVNRRGDFK